MRLALASAPYPASLDDAVARVSAFIHDAADREADVVCFPESYLPGIRGQGWDVPLHDAATLGDALDAVRDAAREAGVAAIIPMDWWRGGRLLNIAAVVDRDGTLLGSQAKTQIPLEEEPHYAPGAARRTFDVAGTRIGVSICHEAWRYPETVRWAARRGARVVFNPHFCGSGHAPCAHPGRWGMPDGPVYERLMSARAAENGVWFASVNYALRWPESATSLVAPDGSLAAHAPYGEEHLLVADIDPSAATGILASRLAPDRYGEGTELDDPLLAPALTP